MPTKNVLKYPGSKWRIADRIVSRMPPHHSYLEPFFGSGAVLFNKQPSKIETVNDLDGHVVNLFSCIRNHADSLSKIVCATPHSREEYDNAYICNPSDNEIEQARKFLIRCWMSYGSKTRWKGGWRHDVHGREAAYCLSQWYRLPKWIGECAERLRHVQIENRPAVEVMAQYNNPRVLIYADPPYLLDTRSSGKQYACEMSTQNHVEFLQGALNHTGPIIISGYDSELYNRMLAGWEKESIAATAEHGAAKTEVIWYNFPCGQMKLF